MKTCVKCGGAERYADGRCKPCTRATSAAWRAANTEKYRTTNAAWAAANKAAWKASNPEATKAHAAKYRLANKAKLRAKSATYYAINKVAIKERTSAWQKANREKRNAYTSAWAAANPEALIINSHNYRARIRATGGRLSKGLTKKLLKLQRGKCACGCKQPLGDSFHRDHIMPLALGGSNTDDNIQLLRAICNMQKTAKHPIDFMQKRGFLL